MISSGVSASIASAARRPTSPLSSTNELKHALQKSASTSGQTEFTALEVNRHTSDAQQHSSGFPMQESTPDKALPFEQSIPRHLTTGLLASGLTASTIGRIGVERAIEELVPDAMLRQQGTAGVSSAAQSGDREQSALAAIRQTFQQRFASQAGDREAFHALMRKSFGDSYDVQKAEAIRQQTLAGDFSWMPEVKVVDGAQLTDVSGQQSSGEALGAYSKSNDTIYLSRELLASDPSKAEKILTEEIGHGLDVRLNTSDAAGDEGAIFSRLSHGESISAAELSTLRAENDSGTIRIDGKEIEVEYGLISKLKKGFKKLTRGIRRGIKGIARGIKKGFQKIMQSKILGVVLSIARFVPIPFVQAAAHIVSAARAAYSVYQGVKHGSMGAILGGVAGLASGVARFGGAINATGSWVNTAQKIANVTGTASKAYVALARKDFGAVLSLLSGQVGQDTALAGLLKTAQSAHAIHQAGKNGDFLGAIGSGAAFLQDFTGPAGDRLLDQIASRADTARALKTAFEKGDVAGALNILNTALGNQTHPHTSAGLQKASNVLHNLMTARDQVQRREFAEAAASLGMSVQGLAPDSALSATLGAAAVTLRTIDSAVSAARRGDYTQSSALLGQVLNKPLDHTTLAIVRSLENLNQQAQQFSSAVRSGNVDTASRLLSSMTRGQAPALVNLFKRSAPSTLLLRELGDALETGQYARASNLAERLSTHTDSRLIKAGLQRLSTILEGQVKISSGEMQALPFRI